MPMTNPFNIVGNQEKAEAYGKPYDETEEIADTNERIKKMVNSTDIFLFIKGTPEIPQCGFSANTVGIFNSLKKKYQTFDILSDANIRSAAKEFSNWPTFPQIYIKGELLGGNDILTEMHQSGELAQITEKL